jgi:hypothetical protein
MLHRANIRPVVNLALHAAVASVRAFVRHWANIRSAIYATVTALLLAYIAVTSRVLVRHRTNIRAGESIFLSELAVGAARRVLVRHRTNIRTGEDLLLASALLIARVIFVALRRMNIGP